MAILVSPGSFLALSWVLFGAFLGALWGSVGPIWGLSGTLLAALGPLFGSPGALLVLS